MLGVCRYYADCGGERPEEIIEYLSGGISCIMQRLLVSLVAEFTPLPQLQFAVPQSFPVVKLKPQPFSMIKL